MCAGTCMLYMICGGQKTTSGSCLLPLSQGLSSFPIGDDKLIGSECIEGCSRLHHLAVEAPGSQTPTIVSRLTWAPKTWTQAPKLAQQVLNPLSHPSSLIWLSTAGGGEGGCAWDLSRSPVHARQTLFTPSPVLCQLMKFRIKTHNQKTMLFEKRKNENKTAF